MSNLDPVLVERYGRALFQAARKEGKQGEIVEQIEVLAPVQREGQPLRKFLMAPQISRQDKEALLGRAFKAHLHPLLYHFFVLMLRKGRMDYIRPAALRFVELVEEEMGIHEGVIASAVELDDSQRKVLQEALEKYLNMKLRIRYRTVPNLIGGVRFTSGGLLIDDTVRGKLSRLQSKLEAVMHQ